MWCDRAVTWKAEEEAVMKEQWAPSGEHLGFATFPYSVKIALAIASHMNYEFKLNHKLGLLETILSRVVDNFEVK